MNPSIRETAGQILESEGYEVLTAKDGVDGLNALSKSLPDLIISDLNMPRMSGVEFLSVLRERFPHIATIAISGGHSSGEMPIGIQADAFLQKGNYTIKELSQQVGKLLAASPLRSEKRKSDDNSTIRPQRQCRVSNDHLSQVPASQQTGSDEPERWLTPNEMPDMWHASEIRN